MFFHFHDSTCSVIRIFTVSASFVSNGDSRALYHSLTLMWQNKLIQKSSLYPSFYWSSIFAITVPVSSLVCQFNASIAKPPTPIMKCWFFTFHPVVTIYSTLITLLLPGSFVWTRESQFCIIYFFSLYFLPLQSITHKDITYRGCFGPKLSPQVIKGCITLRFFNKLAVFIKRVIDIFRGTVWKHKTA